MYKDINSSEIHKRIQEGNYIYDFKTNTVGHQGLQVLDTLDCFDTKALFRYVYQESVSCPMSPLKQFHLFDTVYFYTQPQVILSQDKSENKILFSNQSQIKELPEFIQDMNLVTGNKKSYLFQTDINHTLYQQNLTSTLELNPTVSDIYIFNDFEYFAVKLADDNCICYSKNIDTYIKRLKKIAIDSKSSIA